MDIEKCNVYLLVLDNKYKKTVLSAVKDDILYAAYKTKVCGGKLTVEEYIGPRATNIPELSAASMSGTALSPSSNSSNLLASLANSNRGRASSTAASSGTSLNESIMSRGVTEMDGWGDFWDVANAKYAISKEKVRPRHCSSISRFFFT